MRYLSCNWKFVPFNQPFPISSTLVTIFLFSVSLSLLFLSPHGKWYYAYLSFSLLFSCSVMSDFLQPHGLQDTNLPWPSLPPRVCSISCPLNHWCIQPSHPLLPSSPPVLNLSQHQGLLLWIGSSHQVVKVLELQHQSFQRILRADFL